MRYKFAMLSVAFLILISGCMSGGTANLTLETVTKAIEGQGVKLASKGQINEPFLVLNKVKPYGYWIGNNTSDESSVNLDIYVLKSEKSRTEAFELFNKHLQQAKLASYPNVYEKKNVMIVYFSDSEVVRPFDEKLKKAIQNL